MSSSRGKPDRHRPRTMVAIRPAFVATAEALAKEQGQTLTELVNQAVRELLARAGKWPPPPESR